MELLLSKATDDDTDSSRFCLCESRFHGEFSAWRLELVRGTAVGEETAELFTRGETVNAELFEAFEALVGETAAELDSLGNLQVVLIS